MTPEIAAGTEESAQTETESDDGEAADSVLADIAPGGIEIAGDEAVEGDAAPDDAQNPETDAEPDDAQNPETDAEPGDAENPETDGETGKTESTNDKETDDEEQDSDVKGEAAGEVENQKSEVQSGNEPLGYGYKFTQTDSGIMVTKVVTDCPHNPEDRVTGSEEYDISCIPLNANQHQRVYQSYSYELCNSCGLYVSYVFGEVLTENVNHDFSHGSYCWDCSYYCRHEGLEWSLSEEGTAGSWEPLNEQQHRTVYYDTWTAHCDICGEDIEDERPSGYGDPEPHDFNEFGECECGEYIEDFIPSSDYGECEQHPGGHGWVQTGYYYTYDHNDCKPNDDGKTHTITGYSIERYWQCKYCGLDDYTSNECPNSQLTDNHNFNSKGYCDGCGYFSLSPCEHPNVYVDYVSYSDEFITDEPIISNGDGTHTGKLIQTTYYVCPDCGAKFYEDTIVTGTSACEYHEESYDSDLDDFIFICNACGARDPSELCTHPNIQTEETIVLPHSTINNEADVDYHSVAKDLGNGQHQWDHYYTATRQYCPDCGWQFTGDLQRVDKPYTEPHSSWALSFSDPNRVTCSGCLAIMNCQHENQVTPIDEEAPVTGYRIKDEREHYTIREYDTYCEYCGLTIETQYKTLAEPHDWSEGVVCPCGAVKPASADCQHPNATFTESSVKMVNDVGDDDTHDVVTVTTKHWTCPDCGEEWDETSEPVTEKVAHTYVDGVCTTEGCGHVCTHAKKQLGEPIPDSYAADDATHTPSTITPWTCPSCGTKGQDASGEGTPEKHSYVEQEDGSYKCSICEHVCGHSNATQTPGGISNESYDKTPTTHTHKYQQEMNVACPDCGFSGTTTEDKADAPENHTWVDGVCSVCKYECEHDWSKLDGVCGICGYVCPHEEWVAGEPVTEWSGEYDAAAATGKQHVEKGVETTPQICSICGIEGEPTKKDVTRELPHEWRDGVCVICGYECVHEDYEVVPQPGVFIPTGEWKSDGAGGHSRTGRIETQTKCGNCGIVLETAVTDENAKQTEKHSMANGVCIVCGYKAPVEPKPEATQQPVIEDEPLFIAVDSAKYGLSTGTRMGVALCQAASGIQAQDGAAVTINIWKAEEIIGVNNAAELDALPAQEKVLVMLSVLDYDDEVGNALTELNLTLSPEAMQLIADCKTYIGSLTGDALTAYNDARAKYFPDGTLTLEITSNGTTRLERYSFTFTDGAWLYIGLSVA